ncbi:PREDICTED: glyoxylate/hydroxypyruvate reductase HPR3-like [Tarenaya hassleriana]|uniref:glyoxylate/hydroxypyruvate reductase HPR3-like n=1 Tax=Tarenaya hassleriana TaxID=28532 RepID=UPI00053C5279|nr:PREDICTED: glyoxylate/hydroxypyruvate reductase HPR3-like [Tarenaya hassleriana]
MLTMTAHERHQHDENEASEDLPRVLIPKLPISLSALGDRALASDKFRLLKAYESNLPLPQFLAAHSRSVSAIVAAPSSPVTADLISLLPALRLVVTTSIGVDHVDVDECRRRGISVTNAGSVFSEDVADTAVGLLIDVLRRISASDRFVKRGLWPIRGDYPLGSKLRGKRIGIVGLGSIGLETARRLEAFGCRLSYTSRTQKHSIPYRFYADTRDLAANSDALILCCPLTEQTRHMVNKEVFSAMGKEGVIINVGRGGVIDQKEMVHCLMEGEIAGAGLDVFENEPNVPKELFDLDNVVLLPHTSAITLQGFEMLRNILVGNLEAFFSGKPLLTPVLDCQHLLTCSPSCIDSK